MTARKAFFPLHGERIEIDGDSATLNGEPVSAEAAAALIDQRLGAGLPPDVRASFALSASRSTRLYVAPLGSDPDDPAAWTEVAVLDGIPLEYAAGVVRQQLDRSYQVPGADDGGI